MRIFNADGSEAETCGNGIRCFAKYVYERGLTQKDDFVIATGGGPNRVQLHIENGEVVSVRSNMGKPKFDRAEIPMEGPPGHVLEEDLDLGDQVVQVTCANIGNPHAVVFVDDATKIDLHDLGPRIETHKKFPKRTNVEFVNVIDRQNIVMRIWERGSGVTMASGSGSCGAALAAMITDRIDRKVQVHLVYGALGIEWAGDGYVYQEGPATEVYSGAWPLNGAGRVRSRCRSGSHVLLSGNGTSLQNLIDRANEGTLDVEIVCVVSSRPGAFGLERARNAGHPSRNRRAP